MTTLAVAIRRHPLVSFFVLAFVIGWAPWPFGGGMFPVSPLLAALIVAAVTGTLGDLGRRMIRWRVPWWCYLAAIGLPLLVILSTAAIMGGGSWRFAWADLAILFALRWVNPLDGPLGEEPGWRGFALPRLDTRHAPLVSAAVLGAVVAVWHLPLLFTEMGNRVGPIGIVTTFVITFVYCWLFRRSGGSVLLTMLFHVTQGTIVPGTFGYAGDDVDRLLTLGCVTWTVIALALIVLDRGAWRVRPPEAPAGRPPREALTTPIVQP
ncbi:CPBP family intramembrane glutamic endopeptidase [Paractinoplanes lichenicola]|uniref:CPBP family intramembrane metalloprotease n=1 Tax=Paractinoplanes lichenicola TaxID=2802976 RepID=A0ABS1VZP4_9ACTN|nr:CPBP family intramembrane glutamic endopeptidase [Actinoplanes lichenicola]MBL7259956.1 CPBP family intramembrane metalloprotease [Actinoplanes lichenicola]